jgi:RNA polymerase sigma-70 factor (ECF subfamily)
MLASCLGRDKGLLPGGDDVWSNMDTNGLEAVYLAHRHALLRFLRAHGAGDAAEDLLHELWLRLQEARPRPIAQPLAYLYRAANNLMLDRYRSVHRAAIRERDWTDATGGAQPGRTDAPSVDRALTARQELDRAHAALAALGPRVEQAFRRHRLDDVPQRALATELGVSLSTIESDLRKATRALIDLKRALDEGAADSTPL